MRVSKFILLAGLLCLSGLMALASDDRRQTDEYQFFIDLTKVENDRIPVELIVPTQNTTEVTYNIPKIVPGTYSEDDYGRFIEKLVATDRKGRVFPLSKQMRTAGKFRMPVSCLKSRIGLMIHSMPSTNGIRPFLSPQALTSKKIPTMC